MDVHAHRLSARTTDPAILQAKVDRIDARLRRNPRARYERHTRPLNDWDAFAQAEAQLEQERDRGI